MLVQLATVEEAYNHKKETKETIEEVIWLCSLFQLQDTLDAVDEGTDEYSLLLAVNKILFVFKPKTKWCMVILFSLLA